MIPASDVMTDEETQADRRAILLGIADLIDAGRGHILESRLSYFAPHGTWGDEERACGCALGAAFVGAQLRLGASLEQALASTMKDGLGCARAIAAALGLPSADDLDGIEIEFPGGAGLPWSTSIVEQISAAHVSGEMTTAEIADTLRRLAEEG